MTNINNIFMKISAKHGSKHALNAIENQKEENRKTLTKLIEFIVLNLQAEFERISSCILGQMQTKEIGNQLKIIIEEHLNKLLYLLEIEKEFGSYLEDFLSEMMNYYRAKIEVNEKTKCAFQQISALNLIHDFHQIVDNLRELDLAEKERLLTYLVMLNIKRRIDRRLFLTK